jgi:hypothetical protein
MFKSSIRFVLAVLLIQSMLFSGTIHAEQLSLPAEDLTAPEVQHEPIGEPVSNGIIHRIKATVKDNVEVDAVSLFYRRVGHSLYQRRAMLRETQDSDVFSVTLGREEIASPGIEYYIQATDLAGNSVLYGYSFEPIKLSVVSDTDSVGDTTDTELSEASSGEADEEKKGGYKWLWIALGALAVGAVAAAASGGGGGDSGGSDNGGSDSGDSGTVTIGGPVPQQ